MGISDSNLQKNGCIILEDQDLETVNQAFNVLEKILNERSAAKL